jgi:hypothetical protein
LQITSEDTLDETTKIITKGLYFKNAIDNSTQLIINNDGLFILDLSNNIISLQDWMDAVTKIIKILGGIMVLVIVSVILFLMLLVVLLP